MQAQETVLLTEIRKWDILKMIRRNENEDKKNRDGYIV